LMAVTSSRRAAPGTLRRGLGAAGGGDAVRGEGQAEVADTDPGTCLARRALRYRW
jgi:hypothetical protein